jgi:hypothetical protein
VGSLAKEGKEKEMGFEVLKENVYEVCPNLKPKQ